MGTSCEKDGEGRQRVLVVYAEGKGAGRGLVVDLEG